MEDNTKAL